MQSFTRSAQRSACLPLFARTNTVLRSSAGPSFYRIFFFFLRQRSNGRAVLPLVFSLFTALAGVLFPAKSAAQTLINPAGNGGFESGTTFAANGWTVANDTLTNKWTVGTAATGFSNRSAYISNDLGTTNAYNMTRTAVVHFYTDVTFPAGQSLVTLSFNWKGAGEATLDQLLVSMAPTSYTPAATATSLGTNGLSAPATTFATLSGFSTVQNFTITVPGNLINNCSAASTRRLIFTWKNNGSGGTNPPAAIDNISLVAAAPPVAAIAVAETSGFTDNDGTICATASAMLTASGGGTYAWSTGATTAAITVTPGTTTTYTVTVTTASSCTSTVSRTITVDPIPTPLYNVNFDKCQNDAAFNVKTAIEAKIGHTLGTGVTFTGTGITGNLFDPGSVPGPGVYNINVNYACPDPFGTNDFFSVEVFSDPVSALSDRLLHCVAGGPGSYYLPNMFKDSLTTDGGVFTVVSGPGHLNPDGLNLNYDSVGCFTISYRAPNPAPNAPTCETTPPVSTANLLITEMPRPSFNITYGASAGCTTDTTVLGIVKTSPHYPTPGVQYRWHVTSVPPNAFTINDSTAAVPVITVNTPNQGQVITVSISLTEILPIPAACGAVMDTAACMRTTSVKSVTVYRDSFDCMSNCKSVTAADICDIETNPYLELSCNFFNLGLPITILDAEISTPPGLLSCSDTEQCIDWEASLFGVGPVNTGPKLGDLPGLSTVCKIITYRLCIPNPLPIGPHNIACIKPFFFLPNYILDACDKTITQVILDGVATLAGGEGGAVVLWVDTDGDGSFDTQLVDEGLDIGIGGSVCIPNNVQGQGTITARVLASWPNPPSGICGLVQEPINLLDVIPIGAIPIIGPPLVNLLESGGCGINIAFSDEQTVQFQVVNDQKPVFLNCPDPGYTFANEYTCSTPANWSIPVAVDDCSGGALPFLNVAGTEPGIRKISGPDPGTFLAEGPHTVTYQATACNGLTSSCSFTVNISPGNLRLLCPNSIAVGTDPDRCDAVVTGLTPLEGIGCNTVITYGTSGATIPALSGMTDISGATFKQGTTTVTYTMNYDSLGMALNKTCQFTVTVADAQKPQARCKDVDVQLDNTGSATVTALQIDGGSSDNCGIDSIQILGNGQTTFGASVNFDCSNIGGNTVTLRIKDNDGNVRTCLASVNVRDFFKDFTLNLDVPELCLEHTNPGQLNFANYLTITKPNGVPVPPSLVGTLGPDIVGGFGITAFVPAPGSGTELGTSPNDPRDVGYLDPLTGVYTPGSGSGYMTISYVLAIGQQIAQDSAQITGCFKIVHDVFELRQPLSMASPECMCFVGNERIVDLGIVSGGFEPYTIHYTGARLDVDGDGTADDGDGSYTYDASNGYNIDDFQQDLGDLLVVYTQPTWSFTIVDARGCELFRSGSCDNDDFTEGPVIPCTRPQVELTTEQFLCESQYAWQHPIATDNCAVTLYDYRIFNPDGSIDGPHNLNGLVNLAPGAPLPALLNAEYEFQLGVSTVYYYAEDAQGNSTTCTFTVRVVDNSPPYFINCPYPDVVQDAEPDFCEAYVNFALPLASDNCSMPVVTQIDQTGFHTGDRFPVGLTVLYYEAVDPAGNRDTCRVKVIVNDLRVPSISCPADVTKNNDPWLCSAVVDNVPPVVDGPCEDNFAITYSVFADAALTQRKDCGVWDASGKTFDKGMSWVRYTVHSQPLLLISEVNQSGPVDRIEITNLGPAALDITCLMVTRTSSNPLANEALAPVDMLPSLAGTIVPVGGTFVFNFTFNGPANLPACYKIAFKGNLIDEVAVNGFAGCGNFTGTLNSGDVQRICEDDSDTAADWMAATNCSPISIGTPNDDLEIMPDNGTRTSLQSIVEKTNTCTFKINVKDVEAPFCGQLDAMNTYTGPGIANISANACNQSTITVPAGCIIGDVVFSLTGTATPANSKITLISPYGTRVSITELPADTLPALFAQKSTGVWTLDIVPNPGFTPTVTGWSLKITCITPFNMPDQVINNDLGVCGANFTWKHPYFVDNCFDGTIKVTYTSTDAACVPTGGLLLGKGGYVTTKFFCVGTTTVTYTLVDAAGNTAICSFKITVKDAERPVVTCPQDIFINLSGGECGAFVNYQPTATSDNCAVVNTVLIPPSGSWFPIGDSIVRIIVYDAAGNTDTCTFVVHIIEYVPVSNNLICDDLTNVSLDSTCVYVVSADAALEGTDYHCYDDYIITIKNNQGQVIGNSFNASNIGKVYTITVLDPETGNSCWTTMKIEDKLKPKITCPANLTIACSEDTAPAHTGDATVTDCSSFTKIFDDQFTDFGECASPRARIVRTFIATDAWGNQSSCSQTISIRAYNPAALVFPPDITIDCEAAYLNPAATEPQNTGIPSINGAPIGSGGLCATSIGHWDERLEICAGSYEIYRTWKVGNTCLPPGPNNPQEYIQRIRVKDAAGPKFTCPAGVTVSTDPYVCCATAALPDVIISEGCSAIGGLVAKVTGTDPSNGNLITFTVAGHLGDFPANNYWNPDTLAIFPYTQCLPLGNYTVRYTAEDQCNNISTCQFVLTVADLTPPAVSCQTSTTVAVGANGMAVIDAGVFDAGTTDNCCLSGFQVRRMNGGSCGSTQLGSTVKFCCSDVGNTLQVVFHATDCAGNTNECMVLVEVQDKLKPVCQSPADVTVSCVNFDPTLTLYGKATVSDNCCLDNTKKYQGQNGLGHAAGYAQFDTVCNRGTIVRTFTAYDCHALSSSCTQRVVVTYEQDYFVKFPNDVIVTTCDGTGNFGAPTFAGKDCELLGTSFEDQVFTVVPDACFKIERTWTVINWCTYNPNEGCVEVPNPNPNATVNHATNLPGPVIAAPGTLAPWAPTSVKIDPADPLATNYSVFYTGGQYKTTVNGVLTTFTVPTVGLMNCLRYKQIIKVIDTQDPVFADCPDTLVTVCDQTPNAGGLWNEPYYYAGGSHDLCEAPAPLAATATDSCASTGITFHYLLFLDLNGDSTLETVINSDNLPPVNTVFFGNALNPNYTGGTAYRFDERGVPANQQYRFALQTTTNAASKTARVAWNTTAAPNTFVEPELPYGRHRIEWFVADGCGNEAACAYDFEVKDCKAPTVVCLNGLSVNIMPTQMIQLWASDFLQYGEDNCTPANQLTYAIRKSGTGTGFPVDGAGNPVTNVVFTCADLGTQAVELWAMDAAGNADYCETYVIVQDNNGNCPSNGQTATVSGWLKTETGTGLEEASVQLDVAGQTLYDLTDQNGQYGFTNGAPLNNNLTVTPTKDNNPLNGVSTYDLVLISRHILGLEPLGSPYKMIAADANKSGSITSFDIVELRKLILGIYTELPNNTSWRFVDKGYAFPNPLNPFQAVFAENVAVDSIAAHHLHTDFVAVKVGDVNYSAIANATQSAQERTAGTLLVDVDDRAVQAGEEVEVDFKTAEAAQGFQFTLTMNGLEVVEIGKSDLVDASNFGVFADAVTISIDGARQFTLRLRATRAGRLSDLLAISSRITKAEAYTAGGERREVALRFRNGATSTIAGVGFELYQNQPNPFVGKTFIGFHLPQAATATLTVYDEAGRVLYTQKGEYAKGYNSIAVERALVNTNGLLYYKLETATDMATKKMIQSK